MLLGARLRPNRAGRSHVRVDLHIAHLAWHGITWQQYPTRTRLPATGSPARTPPAPGRDPPDTLLHSVVIPCRDMARESGSKIWPDLSGRWRQAKTASAFERSRARLASRLPIGRPTGPLAANLRENSLQNEGDLRPICARNFLGTCSRQNLASALKELRPA